MPGKHIAELKSEEWLRRMYETEQRTTHAIAAGLGTFASTVARALKRFGIKPRGRVEDNITEKTCEACGTVFPIGRRGQRPRRARYCSRHCHMLQQGPRKRGSHAPRPKKNQDTLHNKEWLLQKYQVERLSMSQIAAVLNCSKQSVKWALQKFKIISRSRSEARTALFDCRGRKNVTQAEMIAAYGGKCLCCGETTPEFLTIDHIGGGGNQHRKALGGNHVRKLRQELKVNGWPTDKFRLLCMNCNIATRYGKTCPHQIKQGI